VGRIQILLTDSARVTQTTAAVIHLESLVQRILVGALAALRTLILQQLIQLTELVKAQELALVILDTLLIVRRVHARSVQPDEKIENSLLLRVSPAGTSSQTTSSIGQLINVYLDAHPAESTMQPQIPVQHVIQFARHALRLNQQAERLVMRHREGRIYILMIMSA
jgi:hypothetical protein